jgi:hypothetical protein
MSRRKIETSIPAAELPAALAADVAYMRRFIGRPGHCNNCGEQLRHPNDTNCRACFASDTEPPTCSSSRK